jgi:hypothetical protein
MDALDALDMSDWEGEGDEAGKEVIEGWELEDEGKGIDIVVVVEVDSGGSRRNWSFVEVVNVVVVDDLDIQTILGIVVDIVAMAQ